MAIRSFEGKCPHIAITSYVDESAVVIGDVTVGEQRTPLVAVGAEADIDAHRPREELEELFDVFGRCRQAVAARALPALGELFATVSVGEESQVADAVSCTAGLLFV